jgi:hypothetical protein
MNKDTIQQSIYHTITTSTTSTSTSTRKEVHKETNCHAIPTNPTTSNSNSNNNDNSNNNNNNIWPPMDMIDHIWDSISMNLQDRILLTSKKIAYQQKTSLKRKPRRQVLNSLFRLLLVVVVVVAWHAYCCMSLLLYCT